MDTKQRILHSAEKLFFLQGIANVRLQQIADETGISVGNLAYHYKNKESIVMAVYDKMFDEFSAILSLYLQSPDLGDFDRLFTACHGFFTSHAYYLNNIWEVNRSYDEIKGRWEHINLKMIAQLKKRLEFNISRGTMMTPPLNQSLDDLAQNLWLSITFWIPQQMLLGRRSGLNHYRKALWSQLIPFLTRQGEKEFSTIIQIG
jgi:AcrR family transcriptional regulator